MNLVTIISTEIDKLQRRIAKFRRFGKNDIQTSFISAPAGIDSNPIQDLVAVYAETSEKGKTILVGFINKNAIAKQGELRIFSTNSSGIEQTYIYLTDDGNIELGGKLDNLVKYIALDAALQTEAGLINVELAKIAAVLNSIIPNSYTPVPIQVNTTAAKAQKLKIE